MITWRRPASSVNLRHCGAWAIDNSPHFVLFVVLSTQRWVQKSGNAQSQIAQSQKAGVTSEQQKDVCLHCAYLSDITDIMLQEAVTIENLRDAVHSYKSCCGAPLSVHSSHLKHNDKGAERYKTSAAP